MRSGLSLVRLDRHPTKRGIDAMIERNGYDNLSEAAGNPNMRLNVRLKCAESANPASWAASVRLLPLV
jgi:hypothetical protein